MSPATTPPPVIAARELRFSIGETVAIGPLDLTVPAGAMVGIVGETGSGKSLMCRALTGLLPSIGGSLDGGSLRFEGEELAGADARRWASARRGRIGFMPQASLSSLNPVRRIGAQMRETLRLTGSRSRGACDRRAAELLALVRLRDVPRVLRSYPHELSGGMRQRVMLALALVGEPRLLVADEPTTALDATIQAEVLQLLRQVQERSGMSVVIVSHDLRSLSSVCDTIVVMYAGRVVESGPTATVLARPSHPYTRGLLASDPALTPRGTPLRAIEGRPLPADEWGAPGCRFAPRCGFATADCTTTDPPPEPTAPGTQAACLHWKEVVGA